MSFVICLCLIQRVWSSWEVWGSQTGNLDWKHCWPKQRQTFNTCDVKALFLLQSTKLKSLLNKLKFKVKWPRSNLSAMFQHGWKAAFSLDWLRMLTGNSLRKAVWLCHLWIVIPSFSWICANHQLISGNGAADPWRIWAMVFQCLGLSLSFAPASPSCSFHHLLDISEWEKKLLQKSHRWALQVWEVRVWICETLICASILKFTVHVNSAYSEISNSFRKKYTLKQRKRSAFLSYHFHCHWIWTFTFACVLEPKPGPLSKAGRNIFCTGDLCRAQFSWQPLSQLWLLFTWRNNDCFSCA